MQLRDNERVGRNVVRESGPSRLTVGHCRAFWRCPLSNYPLRAVPGWRGRQARMRVRRSTAGAPARRQQAIFDLFFGAVKTLANSSQIQLRSVNSSAVLVPRGQLMARARSMTRGGGQDVFVNEQVEQ